MFSSENSLRKVHWISLVGVEEWRLPNTSTDVWLCTFCHVADSCCGIAHTTYYSGTFEGGYSARFIASNRAPEGAGRALYPSKQPRENTGLWPGTHSSVHALYHWVLAIKRGWPYMERLSALHAHSALQYRTYWSGRLQGTLHCPVLAHLGP